MNLHNVISLSRWSAIDRGLLLERATVNAHPPVTTGNRMPDTH